MDKLLKELNIELEKIEEMKKDYKKKNELCGNSDFDDGAIVAIENTVNHIKRAMARAIFPDKIEELQKWIGVLCDAHECKNEITRDAVAEQVVYEMFKEDINK